MRIRTIKPEYWSHPVMAKLPDESRLAAIGLLSLSDDEGFFLAEPPLIRSALWPFDEDSLKAHRVLQALIESGWIEVRSHPSHGRIGLVLNFRKHQKICRPSPSKLKPYFDCQDSLKAHGAINDRSSPDQGSGIREQGSGIREQLATPGTENSNGNADAKTGGPIAEVEGNSPPTASSGHRYAEAPSLEEVKIFAARFSGEMASGAPGPIDADWAEDWWGFVDNSAGQGWGSFSDWRKAMVRMWRKQWRVHRARSARQPASGEASSPPGGSFSFPSQEVAALESLAAEDPNDSSIRTKLEAARRRLLFDDGAPAAIRIAQGKKLLAGHVGNPDSTVGSLDRKKASRQEYEALKKKWDAVRARAANVYREEDGADVSKNFPKGSHPAVVAAARSFAPPSPPSGAAGS